MAVLIGIDVGTTNWKAAAFDSDGRMLAIRTTPTQTVTGSDGRPYYDPTAVWETVAGLLRQVAEDPAVQGTVDAVAVTGMGEAVVPVDATGRPAGPVIPWFDVRSVHQADRIRKELGEDAIFRITGLECNAIFTLSKIAWIKEEQPDVYSRTATWLPVVDYVNLKLSGRRVTDFTEASRTLMLDLNTNDWSDEMLAVAGVAGSALPEILRSGTLLGTITGEAAALTGLPKETQIIMGGHDHLCGSLAAGALLGHRILDSSGTAESFVGFSEPGQPLPQVFAGLRLGRYLDPDRWVTWGGILASGRSMDWGIDTFASQEHWDVSDSRIAYDRINSAIADVPIGAGALLYVPHLRGAGAPYWNPRARGAFVGLKDSHTQAQCLRAVVEGLCFEARIIADLTEHVFGTPVDTLNTIGGGARSAVWQQIKADVTGKKVEVPEVEEATVMGAALLAGVGTGVFESLVDASERTYRVRTSYRPNPEVADRYRPLFDLYRELYETLRPANERLAAIEETMRKEETK